MLSNPMFLNDFNASIVPLTIKAASRLGLEVNFVINVNLESIFEPLTQPQKMKRNASDEKEHS